MGTTGYSPQGGVETNASATHEAANDPGLRKDGDGMPPVLPPWELEKILYASREPETLLGVAATQAVLLAQIADSLKTLSGGVVIHPKSAGEIAAAVAKACHDIVQPELDQIKGEVVKAENAQATAQTDIGVLQQSSGAQATLIEHLSALTEKLERQARALECDRVRVEDYAVERDRLREEILEMSRRFDAIEAFTRESNNPNRDPPHAPPPRPQRR